MNSETQCPHDRVAMVRRERFGLIAVGCAYCGSLWLPSMSWRSLCRRARIHSAPVTIDPTRPARICPVCTPEKLQAQVVSDVEIDMCRRCGGVWLDSGEIQKLLGIKRLSEVNRPREPVLSASADNSGMGLAGEIAETGLEIFAELVGSIVMSILDSN